MNKYVLIVAGGNGSRMNMPVPKQFLILEGLPLLMHTINTFISYAPEIRIILVLPEDQISYWKNLCISFNFSVNHEIVIGGSTRFHSVKNGLHHINSEGVVFIHDGVRPLVSKATIDNCYNTAVEKGNALPVIQTSESIRKILKNGSRAVDRNNYCLVQTPQTFYTGLIKKAYDQDFSKKFTDDASVLESMGIKINLVNGNRENIKITYPEDIVIAGAIMKNLNRGKIIDTKEL
ncbi:MAG: 2-C-methyl-D-erythritol 4-phosphate cytidylyltransferase [Prolixibacteraceae bacterium]|nr:2-C-methyl-D-erythritol 4-phosphate cytidylyltransferase [Prolixibacteraceae bacterium]